MLNIWVHLVLLAVTILLLFYYHLRKQYSYWKDRNIPCDKPSLFLGSLNLSAKKGICHSIRDLYDKSKTERFYGIWFFNKPVLMINDLEIVKDVLVKEFMSFHDHGVYYNEKVDPLSANLFAIEGEKWRKIRTKMTPTFTSGKMKMMYPAVKQCSDELREVLQKHAEMEEAVEVKDLIGRFSTDVISSVAFGIETNSLKNPDSVFRVMGRKVIESTWSSFMRNFLMVAAPDLARLFKVKSVPKKVEDFFTNAMKDTIRYREINNLKRNDFLQLLIQLMNKGYVEDPDSPSNEEKDKQKFTFEEALPEAFVFFVGGFETTSTTMQFILYELAINPDIQDRLREEIRVALENSGGTITYDNIHKMKYMGWVIEEALRKHPPAPFLFRVCTKPYRIPDTDIVLEKGTSITIPNYAFQNDERYFPDPERFDPERFSEEKKLERNHYAYLPFGEGPRVCIGQRFAIMQVRTALATILANFRVSVAEGKTPIPLEYDHKIPMITARGGMYLKISPL